MNLEKFGIEDAEAWREEVIAEAYRKLLYSVPGISIMKSYDLYWPLGYYHVTSALTPQIEDSRGRFMLHAETEYDLRDFGMVCKCDDPGNCLSFLEAFETYYKGDA